MAKTDHPLNHRHAVTALHVDMAELKTPGAFQFEATDKGLFYLCPCGCGEPGYLGFRGKSDPPRPSWVWDGDRERPTLEPSIRRTAGCKWHGHLVKGVWTPCTDSGR